MKEKLEPASLEFERAFCHSGSPVIDCQLCGRTNYDMNGEFMDEGELEGLTEKQRLNPEKYHGQDGTISWGHINGRQFVAGCPCNVLRKYEDFIWSYSVRIAEYLKARSRKELKEAEGLDEIIQAIPKDL